MLDPLHVIQLNDTAKCITLDILFRQITMFIKVHVAFVFVLQTLLLMDFSKIYQLKVLEPKNATRSFMNVVTWQKSISSITYLYGKYQILCADSSCLKIESILFISICVRTMEDKNWHNILGIPIWKIYWRIHLAVIVSLWKPILSIFIYLGIVWKLLLLRYLHI